jgi:FkbH-like protein
MKTLKITSTCNLLERNNLWGQLRSDYQLIFGGFADWPTTLQLDDSDCLIWSVFLRDVISPFSDITQLNIESAVEDILLPLKNRLANTSRDTVIFYSDRFPDALIRNAKSSSDWNRLTAAFKGYLNNMVEKYPNLYFVEIDQLFAEKGYQNCFDTRNYYSMRCHLSLSGLSEYVLAIKQVMGRIYSSSRKLLILDCDNTIWGGVVGEVGIKGLKLGQDGIGAAFFDFQLAVNALIRQGVLVGLCSKNNESDVLLAFNEHKSMALRIDDMVAYKVNWDEKSTNINKITQDLDLGLDSVVFWDDNPLERAKVRELLPNVDVPELPDDVTQWPELLLSYSPFAKFSILPEDLKKNQQYKQRGQFIKELQSEKSDIRGFLRTINLQPSVHSIGVGNIARASQLILKTNQFNLRCARHTFGELEELIKQESIESFLINLSDKFGDHGTVGLVIAVIENEQAFLDTFLFSCRVLGRHIESWAVNRLVEVLRVRGCKKLYAEYIPSARNQMCKSFLVENGFNLLPIQTQHEITFKKLQNSSEAELYSCDLDKYVFKESEIFNL